MSLPPVRVSHPHVLIDPSVAEGSPVIVGSKVPVRRLYSWHRQGTSVETLLRRYPQLGPARIFDALAFAYDNLELVTADLVRERDALARENAPLPAPPLSPRQRALAANQAQTVLPFRGTAPAPEAPTGPTLARATPDRAPVLLPDAAAEGD